MKNNRKIHNTMQAALSLMGMLALASCHGNIDEPENVKKTYPNPTAVVLSVEGQTITDEMTMYEGDVKTVKLSWTPSDAKALKYKAKIQNGKTNVDYEEIDATTFKLIAKDNGSTSAKVTVTFLTYEDGDGNTKTKEMTKSFNLSILKQKKDAPKVTGLNVLKDGEEAGDTLFIKKGATAAISLEVKPSDAIVRKIELESSNDVAAVSQDSLGGWMIEGRKAGKGTLTATVTYVTSIDSKTGEEDTDTYSTKIPVEVKDLINFADPEVKKICVERWDKDGDGELSKYEAGLVKNIGVWSHNQDITTFEEMKFFVNLDTIPQKAFLDCNSLEKVWIPTSVKYIGELAFLNATELDKNTSINGSSDTKVLALDWDALEYIGGKSFGCDDVTEIIFGKNVKYIGNQVAQGYNVRKITFLGTTPPNARLFTEYGTWDSVCGIPVTNALGEMRSGYEDFKIDVYVPSGSIEKYNKKYYYYDGKGYSNDEPTEDQIGYYVFDHTAGESLYFGDGKYYQDWYNNEIKWQYPILQDYKTEKPKKGVYYCYYMKEDQLTSNCGRVPFYNFIGY